MLGTAVAGTAAAVTGITLQANAPTGFGEVAGGCQDWTACAGGCQDWIACASRCQDWIACVGDGAPINSWQRYGLDWSKTPSPSDQALHAWPEARDYPRTCPTGYAELGNGPPSCPASRQAVNTRFRWMQENGQDPAARQRFNPIGGTGPTGGEGRPPMRSPPGCGVGRDVRPHTCGTNRTNADPSDTAGGGRHQHRHRPPAPAPAPAAGRRPRRCRPAGDVRRGLRSRPLLFEPRLLQDVGNSQRFRRSGLDG
ncbi:MAG TPA: hypothetical protein VGD29_07900, partial [Actinoplanes sp.]